MEKTETLARLISNTREQRGYSQIGLAKKANLDLSLIENIESGQELFLASSVRQKLAMTLKLNSAKIKSLEKMPENTEKKAEITDKIQELRFKILHEGLIGHKCPDCGQKLICKITVMYDLEDNIIRHPKARCSKCPFQIK
ncbi:MAG: helix-turn-helix domain-containing protein [bacterium]